jgi:hypothetical protein
VRVCRLDTLNLVARLLTAPTVLLSLAATRLKVAPASSIWRRSASSSAVHGRLSFRILVPMGGLGFSRRFFAAAWALEADLALTAPGGGHRGHGPSRASRTGSEQSICLNHRNMLPQDSHLLSERKPFIEVPAAALEPFQKLKILATGGYFGGRRSCPIGFSAGVRMISPSFEAWPKNTQPRISQYSSAGAFRQPS